MMQIAADLIGRAWRRRRQLQRTGLTRADAARRYGSGCQICASGPRCLLRGAEQCAERSLRARAWAAMASTSHRNGTFAHSVKHVPGQQSGLLEPREIHRNRERVQQIQSEVVGDEKRWRTRVCHRCSKSATNWDVKKTQPPTSDLTGYPPLTW